MVCGNLARLTCGNYEDYPTLGEVMENMANTITRIENKIYNLPSLDESDITLIGPFYGRVLLENVCTAILGRIDSFRLLFLKNVQQHPSYELSTRSESAIKWKGDIVRDEKAPQDNKWKQSLNYNSPKVERSLFGDYYEEIYWKVAFQKLFDDSNDALKGGLLDSYRQAYTPENFISRIRDLLSDLYSILSKGVHSELIINNNIIYDKTTVLEKLEVTLELCGIISLVSHMIDSSLCKLQLERAIEYYIGVNERSKYYGQF